MKSIVLINTIFLLFSFSHAQNFVGEFQGDKGIENIQIKIKAAINGKYNGAMTDGKSSYKLLGTV